MFTEGSTSQVPLHIFDPRAWAIGLNSNALPVTLFCGKANTQESYGMLAHFGKVLGV